ncbi:uncharacterized protein LOC120927973 [Rana temporaria]|uniref:uncharacterized protein LOC120927973 n=1 Tax=Rana temporaria TaxID=8407 RepID=UPI001AAD0EC6|nr:uncharacterized protein LOC120927973 [Rana temporaria]
MEVFWVSLLLIPCVMSASICESFLQPPSDTDPVRCMKPEPAILGGDITLTCILSHPMEAFQVTWCEIKGNKSKDLASFSKIYGPRVKQEFSAFISIVPLDPDEYFDRSTVEISKWKKEDEACYGCYFNVNHAEGVPGDVFLADIGLSNEFTCSAPGTDIIITMTPPEIKTQKSEHDVNGNSLLKGRYRDPSVNPSCIFNFSQEAGGEKELKEGSDEMVILQCNATGTEISQINWNKPGNAVGENKTTDGNVTTITSSLQIPLSSLSPHQIVSCNVNHATEGNPDKMAMKAVGKWIWPLLAAVVVVATAAFFICKKHKRSSENSEDKTSKDESQLKNTEETPIQIVSENRDETPEKDFGGKRTENDGLPNHANGYSPRKLEFD